MSHAERFWAKADKSGDCWTWTGVKSGRGYGNFKLAGSMRQAHRVAYELANGPIPPGMFIDHTCHTKHCVRPEHLRLATNKQNMENQIGAHANSRSGYRGVVRTDGRWTAKATHYGRTYYAGTHATPEEAAEAAKQLRLSLFSHNDMDRKTA